MRRKAVRYFSQPRKGAAKGAGYSSAFECGKKAIRYFFTAPSGSGKGVSKREWRAGRQAYACFACRLAAFADALPRLNLRALTRLALLDRFIERWAVTGLFFASARPVTQKVSAKASASVRKRMSLLFTPRG